MTTPNSTENLLARIAEALERLSPRPPARPDFAAADAFVWRAEAETLVPVKKVSRVDLGLLRGVDYLRDQLSATPSVSPAVCRPIMCCCGARAAWANRRWSRPSTPTSTRGSPGRRVIPASS